MLHEHGLTSKPLPKKRIVTNSAGTVASHTHTHTTWQFLFGRHAVNVIALRLVVRQVKLPCVSLHSLWQTSFSKPDSALR